MTQDLAEFEASLLKESHNLTRSLIKEVLNDDRELLNVLKKLPNKVISNIISEILEITYTGEMVNGGYCPQHHINSLLHMYIALHLLGYPIKYYPHSKLKQI